jgi:hypothetical protein
MSCAASTCISSHGVAIIIGIQRQLLHGELDAQA